MQCGYCTPGMIMTAKALLDENPAPTREEIADAIRGNLCRCTGYIKIIDAIAAAARAESNARRRVHRPGSRRQLPAGRSCLTSSSEGSTESPSTYL